MINTNYLQKKVLIDCLEFLGRGQSPSYIEEESEILAINQKCVRNSTVDVSYARAHNSRVIVKDNAILQNGDICINSTGTGTIGRIGLWSSESQIFDNQYFADSHVTVARPDKTKVNPRYLAALLEGEKIQTSLETYCFSGSTNQIELNKAALSELNIEIIPIEAQHIVADILSTIDLTIAQTEAIIAKQQRIKTGLMQDLLTKGIDENGNTRSEETHKFKDSPLGRIPVEWRVLNLAQCAHRVIVGLASSTTQAYRGIGTPMIRNQNIRKGYFDDREIIFLDPTFAASFPNKATREGDVITVRTGSNVGDTAMVPVEYVGSPTFTTLITSTEKDILCPEHLVCYVESQLGQSELNRILVGGGKENLNVGQFINFRISVPPITEQMCIVEYMGEMQSRITEEEISLVKQKKIKLGLMQDLLTGKVRVTELLKDIDL